MKCSQLKISSLVVILLFQVAWMSFFSKSISDLVLNLFFQHKFVFTLAQQTSCISMLSNSGIFGSYRTIGIKENTGCIFVHLVQVAGLDKIKSQQCASMMQFLSVGMKIKLSIGTKPNIFCNDVKDAQLGVHQQHGQVLVLSRGFQLQDCG